MTVRVRKFANPSLERSVVHTDVFHMADAVRTTPNGDLEVLETNAETVIVRKSFASGHWIDADVAIPLADGREAWS